MFLWQLWEMDVDGLKASDDVFKYTPIYSHFYEKAFDNKI